MGIKKRLRGLFFKAVFVLSLISLVPVILIGFHVVRINSRILQQEILQKQQTVGGRLSSVLHAYLTRTSQLFSAFLDLHTALSGREKLLFSDLEYIRLHNPSISYMGIFNVSGKKNITSGKTQLGNDVYKERLPALLKQAARENTSVWGPMARGKDGKLFSVMLFPIPRAGQTSSEFLVVEMEAEESGSILAQVYPQDMEAWVVSEEGEIVFYNGVPNEQSLALGALKKDVQAIRQQLGNETGGEVKLTDSTKWLVSETDLFLPGWKIYVMQPANLTTKLLVASTFHSFWDVLGLLCVMALFVIGVSYWVIVPITRPVERLRKAALRLREDENVALVAEDVDHPNNELGDLSEAFVDLSQVLHRRRHDLLAAQDELSRANDVLEKRVEQRTRELKAATQELVKTERLAAIGQMASIISHEIRNPLAVISNATHLIKRLVASPDPKMTKQFGIIEAEIRQANDIISEVLGYARSRELMLSAIDVNSYVHDMLQSYPLPETVTLKEELDVESVRIKVDAEEIKQALRNVISNAVEAMQQKGTLTVGTKVGKRAVCIFIADTGPGIPAEVRGKMFAPFFTTKARGTGLGLAVVSKAVLRHNGKLFIHSEENCGTCFAFYLKIYRKPGDTSYGTIN